MHTMNAYNEYKNMKPPREKSPQYFFSVTNEFYQLRSS